MTESEFARIFGATPKQLQEYVWGRNGMLAQKAEATLRNPSAPADQIALARKVLGVTQRSAR